MRLRLYRRHSELALKEVAGELTGPEASELRRIRQALDTLREAEIGESLLHLEDLARQGERVAAEQQRVAAEQQRVLRVLRLGRLA